MNTLLLTLALAFTVAVADVQKRQLPTCTNAFTLTNNPCFAGNQIHYFAVPGDNTKFVQCDSAGSAYVVQCPAGRVYDAATTTCKVMSVVNPNLPIGTPAPVVGPRSLCSAQALTIGQFYFVFPGDQTKFYKCTGVNQVAIQSCPTGLVWDQLRVSCVINFGGGNAVQPTQPPVLQNPCTPRQLAAKHLYFTHPDPTKFIQCDLAGVFYVVSCPLGLAWSQFYQTCSSPAPNTGVIG